MDARVGDISDPVDTARAFDYPYDRPKGAFRLSAAGVVPGGDADLRYERHAVLALGSNASTAQLRRKFARHLQPGAVILVEPAILIDHDVVYSAHFAAYGAMPATLWPSPGIRIRVAVTYLDDDQLAVMDRSEALGLNYRRKPLDPGLLRLAGGQRPVRLDGYLSLWGAYAPIGAPVALAALPARGRAFATATEKEILAMARNRLMPGAALSEFVRRLVVDRAWRARCRMALERIGTHAN